MIDTSKSYVVEGMPGVAWHVLGHVERDTADTWWDGIREVDENMVVAVMIGDNRIHEIEVDDLKAISEDEFCSCCGQIGCGWG